MAFDSETIGRLIGANIVGRLSRPVKTEKG
jgi:hypothetical protein